MLSNKPYLVRAFFEWIVDSSCTPLLVMDTNFPRCNVPKEHIENGQITLNIAPQAVRDLKVNNDSVEFKASFSGVVHIVTAPMYAVLAIYAQENGQGMFFDLEDDASAGATVWSEEDTPVLTPETIISQNEIKKGVPHLKLVE